MMVNTQSAECGRLTLRINLPQWRKAMLEDQGDSREAVAARLKRVREILELDKKTFAEKAGLKQQTYGPFELGVRDLPLEAAKKLRKTYNLPLEFLYFGIKDALPHRIAIEL
ncbi:XRE family transcriptional regulator [Pseudanabaena phage Pan4]|nr:XRE family transcriptional regulator [Pseudanabaena phage Pan4]